MFLSKIKRAKHQRRCLETKGQREKVKSSGNMERADLLKLSKKEKRRRRSQQKKGVNSMSNARKRWSERDCRYVLNLWKVHKMNNGEIAKRVQRSESAVASQLNVIRKAVGDLNPKLRAKAMRNPMAFKGSMLELIKEQKAKALKQRMESVEDDGTESEYMAEDESECPGDGSSKEQWSPSRSNGASDNDSDCSSNFEWNDRAETVKTEDGDGGDFEIGHGLSPPPSLPLPTEHGVDVKMEPQADGDNECTNDLEMKLFDRVLNV